MGSEQARGAEKARDVYIVATGVGYRDMCARGIGVFGGARVRQTCLFPHRERIHVGAHQDSRPIAISQHSDDSGRPDALVHVVSVVAKDSSGGRGCVDLLIG